MRPPVLIAAVASVLTALCCLAVVWFVPGPSPLPPVEPPDDRAAPVFAPPDVDSRTLGRVLALPPPDGAVAAAAPLRPLESTLLGTLASSDPSRSRAALLVGGRVRTVGIGDAVEDGAVAEIRRGHVVVDRSGRRVELASFGAASATAASPRAGSTPLAPVGMESPTSFRLDRQDLVARLADPASDWMRARVLPAVQDGRVQGFKVMVPRGSTLEQLGLRTGDVLLGANGTRFDSVAAAMALVPRLQTERRVELDVLRGGGPVRLTYWID